MKIGVILYLQKWKMASGHALSKHFRFVLVLMACTLLAVHACADCVAPAVGIVGWWPGDNNSADQTGANPGVIYGNVSYVPGLVASAFHFFGTNGAVATSVSSVLNITNAITLEAWIKHDSLGAGVQRYVTLAPEKAQIRYGGLTGFYFSVQIAGTFYEMSPGIVPIPGVYYHVVGTYNGTTQCVYIDGQLVAQQAVVGAINSNPGSQVVISSTSETMIGDIDEVVVYDRALTATEIQAHYAAAGDGICKPIKILQQPQSQTLFDGQDAQLSVQATGGEPLHYQWTFNGGLIVGETGSSLLLKGVDFSQPAQFAVVLSNPVDIQTSSNAVLTTLTAPCNLQPQGAITNALQLVLSGQLGTYCMEQSTNLSDWIPMLAITNISGSVIVSGLGNTGQSCFYRAALGPCVIPVVDTTTLHRKVLCGYDGWFRCPGDDTNVWPGWPQNGTNMWIHRSSSLNQIASNTLSFDLWPDMSEYSFSESYAAPNFTYPDGSQAHLFSSVNRKTIDRHFDWMRDYGIDGVFLERFVIDTVGRPWMTNVIHYARAAANRTGRTFALAYDMGGANQTNVFDLMVNDWKWMVDAEKLTQDPRYLHHNGKPVLLIWGFYESEFTNTVVANQIIDFFKTNTTYSVTLIGGGEWWWNSTTNAAWAAVFRRFDVICPWNVGNYGFIGTNAYAATSYWPSDVAAAQNAGMMYLPVLYPGFSWDNLKHLPPGTSKIPRLRGDFLWKQFYDASNDGLDAAFVAMFDEVDEGTAILKVTNNPPTQGYFGTYERMPSDWYLRLTAAGTKVLRGEITNSRAIPITP